MHPYRSSQGQDSSFMDMANPPNDNFSTSSEAQNTYHQESGTNGTVSYTNPTIMVNNMVQQMQYIVHDNRELKNTIRTNNEELRVKVMELNTWKENWKKEVFKIRHHHANAKKTVMKLHREKEMLVAENTRLQIRMCSISTRSRKSNGEVESDSSDGFVAISPSDLHAKSLAVIESLEKQLKASLSEKQSLEGEKKQLHETNRQLQSSIHENEEWRRRYDAENRELKQIQQSLYKQLDFRDSSLQSLDTTNKEVKMQLVQIVKELKQCKVEKQQLDKMNGDLTERIIGMRNEQAQLTHTIEQTRGERKASQASTERQIKELRKTIDEKTQSLDSLFHEYDIERARLEKLKMEHSKCQPVGENYDDLLARYLCGEESLKKKDRELKEVEELRRKDMRQLEADRKKFEEEVAFFKAQADVYKQDFLCEREDRSKLHAQNEHFDRLLHEKDHDINQLKQQVEQYQYGAMRR